MLFLQWLALSAATPQPFAGDTCQYAAYPDDNFDGTNIVGAPNPVRLRIAYQAL